jgi:hypothetical protein
VPTSSEVFLRLDYPYAWDVVDQVGLYKCAVFFPLHSPPAGPFPQDHRDTIFFPLMCQNARNNSILDNSSSSIIPDEFVRVWNALIELNSATITNEIREAAPRLRLVGAFPPQKHTIVAFTPWERLSAGVSLSRLVPTQTAACTLAGTTMMEGR